MPDEPEALGLLALMLLTESRRAARTDAGRRPRPARRPGPRALGPRPHRRGPGARPRLPAPQPARAATRSRRRSTRCTATRRRGSDRLAPDPRSSTTSSWPSPPRRSSRSTAPSRSPRSHGAAAALTVVDALTSLAEYSLYHAIRADLLRRAGRAAEARAEYDLAAARAGNDRERTFLLSRRNALGDESPDRPPHRALD